jgi:hypothetical protein
MHNPEKRVVPLCAPMYCRHSKCVFNFVCVCAVHPPPPAPSQAAAYVHPDKCKLPGSEQAFRLVKHAQQCLLAAHSQGTKAPRWRDSGEDGGGVYQEDGEWKSRHGADDDGVLEDEDEGFCWWQPWECAAHAAPAIPSTVPTSEDEDPILLSIPLPVRNTSPYSSLLAHECAHAHTHTHTHTRTHTHTHTCACTLMCAYVLAHTYNAYACLHVQLARAPRYIFFDNCH